MWNNYFVRNDLKLSPLRSANNRGILIFLLQTSQPCGAGLFAFSRKGHYGKRHLLSLVPCGSIYVSSQHPRSPLQFVASATRNRRNTKKTSSEATWIFCMEPFSFGIIKGEQPLIRGSSASKSPCPCRAKHAAFASQTGLRLKSPTGAFMPSGHRRPFWFSFGAKREQSPPGCKHIEIAVPLPR